MEGNAALYPMGELINQLERVAIAEKQQE